MYQHINLTFNAFNIRNEINFSVTKDYADNTHVKTLDAWRERGHDADFIQDPTKGRGEPKSKTAVELLEFLADGHRYPRFPTDAGGQGHRTAE